MEISFSPGARREPAKRKTGGRRALPASSQSQGRNGQRGRVDLGRQLRSTAAGAALAMYLLAGTASAAAQLPDRFPFEQPAEPLAQALRDVALRTGRNVIAPDELVQP